jgi:hypothetical protein
MIVPNFTNIHAYNYAVDHNFNILINTSFEFQSKLIVFKVSKRNKKKNKWTLRDVKKACNKSIIEHMLDPLIKFSNKNVKSRFIMEINSYLKALTPSFNIIIDKDVQSVVNMFAKYLDVAYNIMINSNLVKINQKLLNSIKKDKHWLALSNNNNNNIQAPLLLTPKITTPEKKNKKIIKKIESPPQKKNCIELENDDVCVICLQSLDKNLVKSNGIFISKCNHKFCSDCIFQNISHGNNNCPICRTVFIENKKINELENKLNKFKINIDETLEILRYVMKKNQLKPSYKRVNHKTQLGNKKNLQNKSYCKFLPEFYTKLYLAHIHPLERDDPIPHGNSEW